MNTFNKLTKEAAAPAAAATGATVLAGKAMDWLGKIVGLGVDAGKSIATHIPPIAYGGAVVSGLGAGYGLARLLNPRAVAKNSDKLLETEALATEIAVTERRLKALEARRKNKKIRAEGEQRYDRFV